MEKFLHYVSHYLSVFWTTASELFHCINTFGYNLISIRCNDPREKIFFLAVGSIWTVLIVSMYLTVAIAILSVVYKFFKKLTADKITKTTVYGRILQKKFSPEHVEYEKKIINDDVEYVPRRIPEQYNVLVVYNGISETFNNKKLFLSNNEKALVPILLVERINRYTGDIKTTLELPEE